MKTYILSFVCCLLFSVASFAQDNQATIYQIQLGAYSKDVDQSKFNNLVDLGLLHFESIDSDRVDAPQGVTRVFLGRYLDIETAEYALKQAKKRGYTRAFLEQDEFTLNSEEGQAVNLTVQIGAFKKVNMRIFEGLGNTVYITRKNGLFKVQLGVYPNTYRSYLEQEIVPMIEERKYEAMITSIR